ncbi:hypothetical protein [Homoserinibacter gongjuensis]|uniref:Uncharacterized protein n=1 Tax=Homoserinibacter gongjuensis TaxID=1162968 RepID=A0ABQ6JUR8_9MICO|nr:hypothetical protein [Homoserinibacter gongjuensis]GMA91739.1 hypothetical protein GCM10025869_22680 [Homoserinibacter gongjuensis]
MTDNIRDDQLQVELGGNWFALPAADEPIDPALDELLASFEPLEGSLGGSCAAVSAS